MSDEKEVTIDQTDSEDKTKENEEGGDDKEKQSLLAQKEHFREKVEKLEKEREELLAEVEKAKRETPKSQTNTSPNEELSKVQEELNKIKFIQRHPEIDAGDVEEIFRLSTMNSQEPEEVLEKNEMVKVYLDKKRKDAEVANAIPSSNRSGVVHKGKPVSEMTREEHEAYFREVMGQ